VPRTARLAIGATIGAFLAGSIGGAVVLGLGSVVLAAVVVARLLVDRSPSGALLNIATRSARWIPAIAGFVLIGLRIGLAGPPAAAMALPAGSGPWTAVVESVGSPKVGSRPAVLLLSDPVGLRIAATLPWYPEVAPGDRVAVGGTLEAPQDDDYGSYLRRIGASGTLMARTLVVDPGGGGGPWESLRRAAASALDRAIPAPEAGLASGILVGLRDRVDRDLAAAFTTAGVSHIVAISGWNIAIVATTLGALTGKLGRRRRTIATGLAIAAYVAFVGPSPSVVRAAAMAAWAMLARDLGRPTSAAAAMGLAVSGLLVLDPGFVDDAGFRLSVLATAGLIAWGTRLSGRLAGPSPGRLRAWLAESLGVSLAAQAATLSVILLDFGRLSIVSPVVNLVVAPFVAPAMAAGALALVVGLVAGVGLPAFVATLAGLPAWTLLGLIVGVVRLGAALPFASVTLEPPANTVAALLAAGGVWAIVRHSNRMRTSGETDPAPRRSVVPAPPPRQPVIRGLTRAQRLTGALLAAATLAVALAALHRPDGATRITVLDVGQGDAILVDGGRGGRLLIDGGPDPGRLLIALDERLPPWDRRLDAVILTHPHEDHVAGLALLLQRYRVGRVFEPGMIGPGPGYVAWNAELAAISARSAGAGVATGTGPTRWSLATGDRLAVDDVDLQVLWPDPGAVPLHPADGGTAINNVSIVLLGEVAGHRFLLAGDIEQGIDPTLIARGLPHVDFLKVAHHGSGTASTQAFLDAVRPRVAAVSVGAGNPYGHPIPATMARLRGVAEQVYRTDLDGSITVTFDGPVERVHATGGRPAASATVASAAAFNRFSCAISGGSATVAVASRELAPSATAQPELGRSTLPRPPAPGPRGSLLYHRPDDGSLPGGGGPPAPLPRPARVAPAALARRRRDRRLARAPDQPRQSRAAHRSRPGGVGRAPP
jgi:competence protein ComEC